MAEPGVPFPMCFPVCTACCLCSLHFSLAVAAPRKCFSWELVKHCVHQIKLQKWLTQRTWSSYFGVNMHRILWEIDKGLSGIWERKKKKGFLPFQNPQYEQQQFSPSEELSDYKVRFFHCLPSTARKIEVIHRWSFPKVIDLRAEV